MTFLHSLAAFLVAVGILVTIHEFGHFWVAKKLGVKILRFSIGFGKPLWMRHFGLDRTELALGTLPLGGYVKMLDEREGEVAIHEQHRAFNRQALWKRTAIVLAGPLANLFFAIAVYTAMYMIGLQDLRPLVGNIADKSIAAQAGLAAGDEITAVGGHDTHTWDAVYYRVIREMLYEKQLPIVVRHGSGEVQTLVLDLTAINFDEVREKGLFKEVGFEPAKIDIAPIVGEVLNGQPAAKAGLKVGDRIVSIDGLKVTTWGALVDEIRQRPEKATKLEVVREGEHLQIELTPASVVVDGKSMGQIGAGVMETEEFRQKFFALERYGFVEAFKRSLVACKEGITTTWKVLGLMIKGEVSAKNISGPIGIAQIAGLSAERGLPDFLAVLAAISLNLFFLNMLPIPLLDGGHLMYYLMELIIRRPVPEAVQAVGQQVGIAFLLGLMGLAFYNDLSRIL